MYRCKGNNKQVPKRFSDPCHQLVNLKELLKLNKKREAISKKFWHQEKHRNLQENNAHGI